ncbi:MAG: Stp1/IreP family PP2C-type Ser/Thr phosphatase [Pseudohongiellaceae bacterium]
MTGSNFRLSIAGLTDIGLKREANEDFIGFDEQARVAVLADGMGGRQAGEVAAKIAVEVLLECLRKARGVQGVRQGQDFPGVLVDAIGRCNHRIYQHSRRVQGCRGMGTTVVGMVVAGARLYAAHVGDSRLYLYREKRLSRLTKDHSMVQEWVDKGLYTEEQARTSSVAHLLTRALGSNKEVRVDTLEEELSGGDIVLLCSDGLSDMMADADIAKILESGLPDLAGTTGTLIEAANNNGGWDNIAVVLVQVQ